MTLVMTLQPASRPILHRQAQIPIFDFLLPSIHQRPLRIARASITTSSASPSSEASPQALQSETKTKRRRPLSREQQQFLDSAVSRFLMRFSLYTHIIQ